jgi:hypothetical protein
LEKLERRDALAIDWINQGEPGVDSDDFAEFYGVHAELARQIARRAISDWERVITDFKYDGDNDPLTNNRFELTLSAFENPNGSSTANGATINAQFTNNKPVSATVRMDDNGGGRGWFFDSTAADDAEFTSIGGVNYTSFVDVSQSAVVDFYRTLLHEIGHALGINSASPIFATSNPLMVPAGTDPGGGDLYVFNNPNGPYANDVNVTFTTNGGRHLYESAHPNELLNPGRALLFSQSTLIPTVRHFVSDLDAKLLANAYGFSVVLPSTLNTAHATLDSQTGVLLVQGSLSASGSAQNDTISLTIDGADIVVQVNYGTITTTEKVTLANVTEIVIAGHGGTDSITVAAPLAALRRDVHYIVSSNQDSAVAGTLGDGVVDLDSVVPGRQITLRAALVDANGTAGGAARGIYVPRGNYNLTITGTGGDTQGDIDVTGNVSIIGASAGATIIDAGGPTSAGGIGDRVFDVQALGYLRLAGLTVTGGHVAAGNGGGVRVLTVHANPQTAVLDLDRVAVVNNQASGIGGGVYNQDTHAITTVLNSVIANNHLNNSSTGGNTLGGAGLYTTNGLVSLEGAIIAHNTANVLVNQSFGGPTYDAAADLVSLGAANVTSLGDNLLGDVSTNLHAEFTVGQDAVGGNPDYIVTSAVDSFDHADDDWALSLRETVDLANQNAGAEIWLPAWKFMLSQAGATGLDDHDLAFGDLEIIESLTLRGAGSAAVEVKQTLSQYNDPDPVFDLIGDFDGDGVTTYDDGSAGGGDYLTWLNTNGQSTDLRADADDDGDVDYDDYDLWADGYGNTLTRYNVANA